MIIISSNYLGIVGSYQKKTLTLFHFLLPRHLTNGELFYLKLSLSLIFQHKKRAIDEKISQSIKRSDDGRVRFL